MSLRNKPPKWQTRLRRRELPFSHVIDEPFLAKMGVTNLKTVQRNLLKNGVETWGEILTLRNESEAMGVTGDVVSGRRVYGFLCRYRNRDVPLFPPKKREDGEENNSRDDGEEGEEESTSSSDDGGGEAESADGDESGDSGDNKRQKKMLH